MVRLRDELRTGELTLQMFAADLYEVLLQRGKQPMYEDPASFFALTYPTYNLRKLVRDVLRRLSAKNDKAVRQLELTDGGGKTHTLITLRHLVTDPQKLPKNVTAIDDFRSEVDGDLPRARVAGLCFDKLDVEKGMEILSPAGKARTLKQPWSVLAYQLAGDEGLKLWKPGETMRRVKDLASAFAQLPHLPKMLKAQAIQETLAGGCEEGTFVLRLPRPDGSFRTWWRSRPDDGAMSDPALELILSEAAEINEIAAGLLVPNALPGLWSGQKLIVRDLRDYFGGGRVVQVDRGGYKEQVAIPKAAPAVVDDAVRDAVQSGLLWLVNGPASILAEPIPAGILKPEASLQPPPPQMAAAEILSETLPEAWDGGTATALSIATALSQRFGQTLPWKTIQDVIDNAIRARFAELDPTSGPWPCEFSAAATLRLTSASGPRPVPEPGGGGFPRKPNSLIAGADLAPAQLQDFGDIVPQLLEIKAKHNFNLRFRLQVELDGGGAPLSEDVVKRMNRILKNVSDDLEIK